MSRLKMDTDDLLEDPEALSVPANMYVSWFAIY